MQPIDHIKKNSPFLIVSFIAGTALLLFAKELLFFDEDVFVTNLQSAFMQQGWQRSYLVKQFLKAQHFFFGKAPAGYHITGLCLHFICAVTGLQVFKILLAAFSTAIEPVHTRTALFIFYIFFLITPVHSEPLCYILAQGVMVFTLFALLSVLFFIKAVTGKSSFIWLSLLFFVLTLFCYEISWMLPFIHLCLFVFLRTVNPVAVAKYKWMLSLPGFALLAVWLYIKTVYISASLVADYGNITIKNTDLLLSARNSLLLFLRSILPPLKNSFHFILLAAFSIITLLAGAFLLFRKQRKSIAFLFLLTVLTVLSFAPASLFGIDSHDSESERYVYFSSAFAIMLLTVLLVSVKNMTVRNAIVAVIGVLYAAILFNTINHYNEGGRFSKKYLEAVSQFTRDKKTVYTINQPSQYKGALLVRALTRLPVAANDNYTVLNEYMKYLYQNDSTAYITVTARELDTVPAKLNTVVLELDSAAVYFPKVKEIMAVPRFQKKSAAVAVLRNDSLFIFR